MAKYTKLSPEGFAKAGAAVGLIWWVLGLGWHGIMGQPSMMGTIYNMPYMTVMMQFYIFIILVGGGALTGWLVARIYNLSLK